jgi:hypothetical protein
MFFHPEARERATCLYLFLKEKDMLDRKTRTKRKQIRR